MKNSRKQKRGGNGNKLLIYFFMALFHVAHSIYSLSFVFIAFILGIFWDFVKVAESAKKIHQKKVEREKHTEMCDPN
jgi:hypothetical protein